MRQRTIKELLKWFDPDRLESLEIDDLWSLVLVVSPATTPGTCKSRSHDQVYWHMIVRIT